MASPTMPAMPGRLPFPRVPRPLRNLFILPFLCTLCMACPMVAAAAAAAPDPPAPGNRRYTLDSVGASIDIPPGSVAEVVGTGDSATLGVIDSAAEPTWSMRMQVMTSTLSDPLPGRQIRTLIDGRREAGGTVEVIADEAFMVSEMSGHLGWLLHSSENGFAIAMGWYCVAIGEREFIVISAQAVPEALARVRPLLDAAARSLQVRSADDVVRDRREGLARGEGVLRSITPARLRQLVGFDQWYRLYRPGAAAQGDEELGAIRFTALAAPLGAVNPQRDPANFLPHEQVEGFAVRIQTRFHDRESNSNLDSEAIYWMSWDASEESWSFRATQRYGTRTRSEATTGIRTAPSPADPLGTLVVVWTEPGVRDSQRWERAVPDVFCPQPIRWMLGFFLPRTEEPVEFACYAVEHIRGDSTIALRRDEWAPLAGRPGRWEHRSTPRPGEPVTRSIHGADGRLIRRELPDGSVMEPIDLARLRELWRRAGIPLSGG